MDHIALAAFLADRLPGRETELFQSNHEAL
jgi:hypothetical protein